MEYRGPPPTETATAPCRNPLARCSSVRCWELRRHDHRRFRVIVSGWVGTHPRSLGAGFVSPRAYRLMFWVGFSAVLFLTFMLLQGIVLPFAAAFVIAYLLDPLVDRIETWGIGRGLASLVVLLGFLLGITLILVLLVPLVQGQIVRLLARFPGLVSATQDQFGNLMELLRSHLPEEEAAKVRAAVGEKIAD